MKLPNWRGRRVIVFHDGFRTAFVVRSNGSERGMPHPPPPSSTVGVIVGRL